MTTSSSREPQTPPGPGVDATGQAVVDPTKNVDALVGAAVKRLDDLRTMNAEHLRELMTLREQYLKELRVAEKERIDAIRAVDVGNVASAATVAATQATTLAAQVATSADTLRTQVAAAAQAATSALAAALEPIQKDIADLRRVQYEAVGGKAQDVQSTGDSRAWTGIVIAAVVGFSTLLLSTGAIVITLLLRP